LAGRRPTRPSSRPITGRDYLNRDGWASSSRRDLGMAVPSSCSHVPGTLHEVAFTRRMEETSIASSAARTSAKGHPRVYSPFKTDLERANADKKALRASLEEDAILSERCKKEVAGESYLVRARAHGPFYACPATPCTFTARHESEIPETLNRVVPAMQRRSPAGARPVATRRFVACSRTLGAVQCTRPLGLGVRLPRVRRQGRSGSAALERGQGSTRAIATPMHVLHVGTALLSDHPCRRAGFPFPVREAAEEFGGLLQVARVSRSRRARERAIRSIAREPGIDAIPSPCPGAQDFRVHLEGPLLLFAAHGPPPTALESRGCWTMLAGRMGSPCRPAFNAIISPPRARAASRARFGGQSGRSRRRLYIRVAHVLHFVQISRRGAAA